MMLPPNHFSVSTILCFHAWPKLGLQVLCTLLELTFCEKFRALPFTTFSQALSSGAVFPSLLKSCFALSPPKSFHEITFLSYGQVPSGKVGKSFWSYLFSFAITTLELLSPKPRPYHPPLLSSRSSSNAFLKMKFWDDPVTRGPEDLPAFKILGSCEDTCKHTWSLRNVFL